MAEIPAETPLYGLAGLAFWQLVTSTYEDLMPSEVALLEAACHTLDTIAALEAAAVEPLTTGSKDQLVVNPAISEARLQRAQLARLLDQLGLPTEADSEAAPSSPATRRARKAADARWSRRDRARGAA